MNTFYILYQSYSVIVYILSDSTRHNDCDWTVCRTLLSSQQNLSLPIHNISPKHAGLFYIMLLKGKFTQIWTLCHRLHTLILYILLRKTNKMCFSPIQWKSLRSSVVLDPITTFFCVAQKKVIQVWNNMRVNDDINHFWMNALYFDRPLRSIPLHSG